MTATSTTAASRSALLGLRLRGVLDELVAQPLEALPVAVLQAQVAAVAPQAGRLEGWLQAAAGELAARTGGQLPTEDGGRRSVVGWLAEVRQDTSASAGRQLRTSAALRTRLPLVAEAVLDGVLTPAQAAQLARLVGKIDDAALAESQEQLIQVAAGRDPASLAAWVSHQIATHCEPVLDDLAERGRNRRYLQHRRDSDGCLSGRFVLPAEDSEAFLTVLEPLARRAGLADSRSAGQRRADALVDAFEQVLRHGDLPDAGGERPRLSYVLPADWAARQAVADSCPDCGPRCGAHRPPTFAETVAAGLPGQPGVPAEHGCATAAWTGPQTRARIETLLCDARINRVLLDEPGQVTGLESLTDSVTPAQRRALAARDLGCVVRGCTRPPALCDAHHLQARADGGATSLTNLALLCRRHHVLWHLGKLTLRDLHVPWHPDSGSPVPDWVDRLAEAG